MTQAGSLSVVTMVAMLIPLILSQISQDQQQGLLAIINATQGLPLVWNASNVANACGQKSTAWVGITCNSQLKITNLILNNSTLPNPVSGSIPSQISTLTSLTIIALDQNSFSGSIPSQLGSLKNLRDLDISENRIFGTLPTQIANLFLTSLVLSNNQISGTIPTVLGKITTLTELNLGANQFSVADLSGPLPTQLGNLSTMITLSLNQNQLTGNIPSQYGNFPSALALDFSNNSLSGTIGFLEGPSSLPNATTVNVQYNLFPELPSGNYAIAASRLHLMWSPQKKNETPIPTTGLLTTPTPTPTPIPILIPASTPISTPTSTPMAPSTSTPTPKPPPGCNVVIPTPQLPSVNYTTGTVNASAHLTEKQAMAFQRFCVLAFFTPIPNSLFLPFKNTTLYEQCVAVNSSTNVSCLYLVLEKNAEGYYTQIGFDIVCRAGVAVADDNSVNTVVELNLNGFPFGELQGYGIDWATNFPDLVTLSMNSTSISTFPTQALPPLLQRLRIQNQYLSGEFPTQVFSLSSLQLLDLTNNAFNSTLPTSITQLTGLIELDVGNNFFYGTIPDLSSMTNLKILDISQNFFGSSGSNYISSQLGLRKKKRQILPANTEPIKKRQSQPDFPALPPNLQTFLMFDNYITGTFPVELCEVTTLSDLSVSKNAISGTLPDCVNRLTNLLSLDLSSNLFTGTIPSWNGSHWANLVSLALYSNELNGTIPTSFGTFPAETFQSLNLGFNSLTGEMPSELGNLASLKALDFSATEIGGTIPASFSNLRNLNTLLLYNTQLGGGRFNFPLTNDYAVCLLGDSFFYCGADAPNTCRCGRCYPYESPCGTPYDFCDSPATCIPDTSNWYTCKCPVGPPTNFYQCPSINYTGTIIGVVIGGTFLLIVLLALVFKLFFYSRVGALPPEVSWSYKMYENSIPFSWRYRGTKSTGYHYKEFRQQSWEYKKAADLFNSLGEYKLKVDKIIAVYNPLLLTNFSNAYLIQKERMRNNQSLHLPKPQNNPTSSEWVYSKYTGLCARFPWNTNEETVILPALHGTAMGIAEKICQTGFASLSSLDAGFFGKGIYFTTHPIYCVPYIASKIPPTIILSYLLPGNVYPVTEKMDSKNSLLGAAIKTRYNSHFVITDRAGKCIDSEGPELFDEVVIGQESQIAPAFIITIRQPSIMNALQFWGTPANNSDGRNVAEDWVQCPLFEESDDEISLHEIDAFEQNLKPKTKGWSLFDKQSLETF